MAIESAVVVAELADMAWTKYSKNLEAKTEAKFVEKEVAAAETALAREQLENKRLRAVLEEYKGALLDLQNRVSATDWLRVELSSDEGTLDIFDQVQKRVDSPEFLALIDLPPEVRSRLTSSLETRYTDKDGLEINVNVADASWWSWVNEEDFERPREERDPLDGTGYVLVDSDDVIDAVANFVARFLAAHPETQNMNPAEIQEAISNALTEIKTKTAIKKIWQWGKFLYTTSSWLGTAVSIYKHPLIVRATLLAVWTSARVILGIAR